MAGFIGAASSTAGLPSSLQPCIDLVREAISWPEQFRNMPGVCRMVCHQLSEYLVELEELSELCRTSVHSRMGLRTVNTKAREVVDYLTKIRNYLHNEGYNMFRTVMDELDYQVRKAVKELIVALESLIQDAEKERSQAKNEGRDYFVPGNHAGMDGSDVVLNFESRGEHGERRTFEGQLLDAVLANDGSKTVTACARGFGGVGKTCALRGVAQHSEVQERFWGGVYYGTLGQDARKERLREEIIEMVKSSGGTRKAVEMSALDFQKFVVSAGQWFGAFPCLFLIDDVWVGDGFGIRDFELVRNLARHHLSRVAFTTRDATLKADKKIYFEHREREGDESRQILIKTAGFEAEPKLPNAAKAFEELLRIGNGLPLKLALIGGGVRNVADIHEMSNYENAWVLYYDEKSDDLEDVKDILMRSLSFLDRNCPDGMHHRRFKSLSVLRYAQRVTISVASRIWGLSEDESKAEVKLLARYHIVRSEVWDSSEPKNWKNTVTLHDDMLSVAREVAGKDDSLSWSARRVVNSYMGDAKGAVSISIAGVPESPVPHTRFGLDARGLVCAVGAPREETNLKVRTSGSEDDEASYVERWPTVESDGYFYENLCWLLWSAKLHYTLKWLISEPQWLIGQLCVRGVGQALGDLEIASEIFAEDSGTPAGNGMQRIMKLMKSTIIASKVDMVSSEWDGMPWFQLYGRLTHLAEQCDWIREYVDKIERLAPRPWYKPSVGCLLPASTSLLETIYVEGYVQCVGLNGNTINCCFTDFSNDFILQKNQLGRDADYERLVLYKADDCRVRNSALSEEGKIIISCMSSGDILFYNSDDEARCEVSESGISEITSEEASVGNVRNAVNQERKFSKKRKVCHGDMNTCSKYVGKHKDVEHVALSRDGETFVSGSKDGTVRVWKRRGGEWKWTALKGHTGWLECVAASGDGARIVSGSCDGTVRMWRERNGNWKGTALESHTDPVKCVSVLALEIHTDPVKCVSVSGDGSVIVSGSQDETVRVWTLINGEWNIMKSIVLSEYICCVSVSVHGTLIVAGCIDGAVHVFKLKDGDWECSRLEGYTSPVQCVSFSSDGTLIVYGFFKSTVRVYDLRNVEWGRTEEVYNASKVNCVSVSADGMQVMFGCEDGMVRVCNKRVGDWKCIDLDGHRDSVSCVSVSGNGMLFVSGSKDGTLVVWTMRGDEWESTVLEGHTEEVRCVLVSVDGTQIVSGSYDRTVRVWKMSNGVWERVVLEDFTGIFCVSMSVDNSQIVTGNGDGTVCVWKMRNGEWKGNVLEGHTEDVSCVAMSEDGSVIVSGGFDIVRVWKERDGEWESTALEGHTDVYNYVSISADGMQVVSENDRKCTITWHFENDKWVKKRVLDVPSKSGKSYTDNMAYGRISFESEMKFPLNEIFVSVAPSRIYYAHRSYFFLREYYPYFSRIDEVPGIK